MAPTARLAEKLKLLGLTTDDNPASAPKAPVTSRKKVTFRVFFPLPPFEPGIHFNALKAGHGTFNFTGLLLGVGGMQLQKIKQESNARVEVVNAYGNLNGTHPDPLDHDLHALVTADNMAKLQQAVDLVVHVLSPTNGSYEPFKVEPGGSARLKVFQQPYSAHTNSAKSSGAHAKPKLTKPLPPVSSSGSRSRASLDGSSSSSCSTKGMPLSPALTPVTPAAIGSRHGSMFASGSSGPSSCSSSRTPTPSPSLIHASCSRCSAESHMPHAHPDCSSAAGSSTSGDGGSKDTRSHLEGFQLPPAALPAAPQLAFPASEWPALPSSQDNSSSSTSTSTASSSSSVGKPGLAAGVGIAGHSQSSRASIGDSSRGNHESSSNPKAVQRSVEYVSIPMSHLRLQLLDVQQPGLGCDSPQEAAQEPHVSTRGLGATEEQAAEQQAGDSTSGCVSATPLQQQSMLAYAGQAPVVISVDCDAAKEHAMLSPLTPQAQQYQYQQKAQQRLKELDYKQGQGAGAVLQSTGQAAGPGCVFGLDLDWQPAGDNSGGSSCAAAGLPPSALQHGPSHCQQLNPLQQQQPCDLDLLILRQRAGLLSQAYLHCDGPVSGVSCACAGVAAPPVALSGPYACFDSSVSLLGPSTGGCQVQGLAGASSGTGAVGGAVQESLEGAGFALQYAHHQLQDGFACQDFERQQREQHMRMVAGATAAANYCNWDGCSFLSSSMPAGPLSQLASTGGGQAGSLPHLGWDPTDYASRAQTAAVAAAASSAFGALGMTGTGVAGDVLSSTCWEGGAGALTAGGFLASKSIW